MPDDTNPNQPPILPPPPDEDDRDLVEWMRVAHHEAGHAVVASAIARSLPDTITLHLDFSGENSNAHTKDGPEGDRQMAVILMAGYEAEHRHNPEAACFLAASDDREKVIELLKDFEDPQQEFVAASTAAAEAVTRCWPAICDLANEIIRKATQEDVWQISKAEIEQVIAPFFLGPAQPQGPRPSIRRTAGGPHEHLVGDPIVLAAIKGILDGIGQHPPLSEAEKAANRERLRTEREAGGAGG